MDAPQRLLFIRTDRLGETLLNLPAAAACKAGRPSSSLTLLVQAALAPLIRLVPWVDEVAVCPDEWQPWWRRALHLARRMRAGRFDAVVVSNPEKEWHTAARLAGIPIRVGYDRKWGGLLTHRIPDRKARGDRHEVECNLDLARALGVPAAAPSWPAFELDAEANAVDRLLAAQGVGPGEPLLAVHPWTSNPAKQWPAVRFNTLLAGLTRRAPQHAVAVIGGPEEASRAPEVLPSPAGRIVNMAGRLELPQLAALLARARVLVSNDSGPVHLASAVGTPAVVLFGSSDPATGPKRWGPWGPGHAVICKPSMDAIAVEDVMAALAPFLHA